MDKQFYILITNTGYDNQNNAVTLDAIHERASISQ